MFIDLNEYIFELMFELFILSIYVFLGINYPKGFYVCFFSITHVKTFSRMAFHFFFLRGDENFRNIKHP